MMDVDIKQLVPRFIWNDKNGRAMAKALEAGLKSFLSVCKQAVDNWGNVDQMPEWRLDEMAWEYNIPYDYSAAIAVKREWIRNAYALSRLHGTPEGIKKYLDAYFQGVQVQENWEYDGYPYHFRLLFADGWTRENIAWANKAVAKVKNVRSVLDDYHFIKVMAQLLRAATAIQTGAEIAFSVSAGDAATINFYTDEFDNMLIDEFGIPIIVED